MDSAQEHSAFKAAEMIAEHLVLAWNDCAIRAFKEILHSFSLELWSRAFCVEDLGDRAWHGVAHLVQSMKSETAE